MSIGTRAAPGRTEPTWEDVLMDFDTTAGLRMTPRQVRRTVRAARRFIWRTGLPAPGAVTAAAVEKYLAGLASGGASPKTLANGRSYLSVLCEHLAGRGILGSNPCAAIRLKRPDKVPARWLDDGQVRAVLSLARRAGIWPEVALALATGLRLSELIRLEWADVDVPRRTLLVRTSKSGRWRTVSLSALALEALAAQRRLSGPAGAGTRAVFPARRTFPGGWRFVDRRRDINWWLRAIKPIQAAVPAFTAGAPGCSTGRGWHLLRHTFASRLAQAGVSLYKIAQWMGHSDVKTTQIYAHLAPGFDSDIDRAFPSSNPPADA